LSIIINYIFFDNLLLGFNLYELKKKILLLIIVFFVKKKIIVFDLLKNTNRLKNSCTVFSFKTTTFCKSYLL
jgi:hypothetical protein